MNRVAPLPTPNTPTIVFSGAIAPRKISALRVAQVESLMGSFEYLQTASKKDITGLYDWPTRRYLDSGVFTIVRKMNVSRIRIKNSKDQQGETEEERKNTAWAGYKELVKNYALYLREHLDEWDHVAEMDIDEVFGSDVTWQVRKHLHEIAGDKLLPVWHSLSGHSSWREMIKQFPYVAVGSDATAPTATAKMPSVPRRELRYYVDEAHAAGCLVHGMGDTKVDSFLSVGWDSADSTTWISGSRFGMFAGTRYSFMESSANRLRDSAHAQQFEDFVTEQGYDVEEFRKTGEPESKLVIAIKLLQKRQQEVRDIINARLGPEAFGEYSGISPLGYGDGTPDLDDVEGRSGGEVPGSV